MESGRIDLEALVRKGGIFYDIGGETPKAVLKNAVEKIRLPAEVRREAVLSAMIEREDLMPTAVGHGIAIPHPRNPLIPLPEDQLISVCFLKDPIDYKALDKSPVFVLFILLSAQARLHLQILSRVSYLCQREDFLSLLQGKPKPEELLAYIKTAQESWLSQ
jgi:nitrogen PTS system EIIA component